MKKCVIDASLVLNALLDDDELLQKKCRKTLQKMELVGFEYLAPNFLKQEVANALVFKLKDVDPVRKFFSDILQLDIQYVEINNTIFYQAIDIALQVKDTVYDATYHALAISRGATFLTCDKKYFLRAKHLGSIELVS